MLIRETIIKKVASLLHYKATLTPTKMTASAYDAASTSRRMRTWGIGEAGPNTRLSLSVSHIRDRSRKLRGDNPWAENGIESHVSNLIGRGITPRWKTGDKGLNREIKSLWDESIIEMDADGILDFYGLQALAATAFIESGEVLGQLIYKSVNSNLLVPLQLKLIEPDFLPFDKNEPQGNNSIKMGVEFNSQGSRVAYHIYGEHPGESYITDFQNVGLTKRVSAKNILHIFKPLRPGQIRGIPWLTSIITRLYQLDQYEDAELMRKGMSAMLAGFITSPEGDPDLTGIPGMEVEYENEDHVSFEPGMIQSLRSGEDIKFSSPADVGQTYEVWIKQQLRAVAAGMGVTYEQLTGDLSDVNYTSIRAGLIEFRRRCRMTQRNNIIHQLCRPFAGNWLSVAVLNNIIQIKNYFSDIRRFRTLWDADGWDFTDPVKDLKGKQMAIRLGLESRSQAVGERGTDAETLDDEISEDNQRADEKELVFDSDPRKTTQGGSKQKEEVIPNPKEGEGSREEGTNI